ncbi:MAG: glycosyltransferase family 2 protein [Candidatus Thiodiazotropha sp. (ex Lucinoma borealis)]|nr:glycosyltransferase family 2 protein [Candidatus Thiodiazotropha sp. (ex Lucinoma borealis)]
MKIIFWASFVCVVYAYFLYPLLLIILGKLRKEINEVDDDADFFPSVTLLLPVHNESAVIESKLKNIIKLDYPKKLIEIIIVSDGSTDNTLEIVENYKSDLTIKTKVVPDQKGKANALNEGLQLVDTEIVVYTDASIMLEEESLKNILKPFKIKEIGCVSGEDHIFGSKGGEGLYGQYELFLRNKESKIDSIVGASGSFYAQRSNLVRPFEEGLAPDFLSVLNTVEAGFRAITEPTAIGIMSASTSTSKEFDRKVRTLLRGMTALFSRFRLLNPIRYRWFSVFLFSHKIMRWLVPFFLILLLTSSILLADYLFYYVAFIAQALFYTIGVIAIPKNSLLHDSIVGKIPLFFTMVNIAILKAWVMYYFGKRQEVWQPTKRDHIEK